MIVNITGMHRSGTSMVARILNMCGLYLGPEERIMPPDEGNPAGYWQNLDMDGLTEAILAHLSGGWDFLLPPMPPNWEKYSDMVPFRKRAGILIQNMREREPWGWKDPRCSLTLPFWKSMLPGLRVIVCLRNPVEAARSITHHVGSTDAFNYNLWLRYYERILADTDDNERLITHYDMFFLEPAAELERILGWLGWSVSGAQVSAALDTISDSLRQQRLSPAELETAKVPEAVVEAYDRLCQDGGEALISALDERLIPRLSVSAAGTDELPPTDTTPPEQKRDAERSFERAQQLIIQGLPHEALELFRIAVTQHPFHARAHNDLGVLLLAESNHEQALSHLAAALKLDPHNSDTAKNLAGAYLKVGRTEDAIQTFLDIVYHHPHDVEALFWLGTACSQLGQREQATTLFTRVLELEPDHTPAQAALKGLQ
ncbi:MAG: tetratricopeptide repeat protein [Candidatus Neomarinimicrobiota bacterium]